MWLVHGPFNGLGTTLCHAWLNITKGNYQAAASLCRVSPCSGPILFRVGGVGDVFEMIHIDSGRSLMELI